MPPGRPPKKDRGKQRKAAKSLAAANGTVNLSKTVFMVRKGDYKTTTLLGDGLDGILYEQSGILSTVLRFLKRCENDTFIKVMLGLGGNMTTPQAWVRILVKAEAVQGESCRLQIAQSIGPLVRCMCNDTTRLFFKSNKHWGDTIQPFAALIHNMILHKDKDINDTLLQYEGLLTSIVQWGFWDKKYRPDIAKELKTDDRINIVKLGKVTVKRLIMEADKNTEEGRKRLETIGTTPIISKEYDTECTISLVVGLIRQIKITDWTIDVSNCIRRLIGVVSCVDKDVITELIDLGFNTSDDKWVANVAVLLHFMILKDYNDGMFYSSDTRAAFAIRGGLVELCLTFIERFGSKESFDRKRDNTSSLFFLIYKILTNIHWIQLHEKTTKAIKSKRCSIEQELARLEQNADIINNVNCKMLLDMARSMLDVNGSYCCRCNKSLSRTEVKLCNGCNQMSYCSRACQKKDWLNGHNVTCCKTYTTKQAGQFQGRLLPKESPSDERAAAKLEALEINLSSVQLKLFLDHSETILNQAKALNLPLHDCLVRFNLATYPFEVTTENNENYRSLEEKTGFESSRSKKHITCIFISCIHDGSLIEGQIEGQVPRLQMQRLFPHEWLSKRKELQMNKGDSQCVLS